MTHDRLVKHRDAAFAQFDRFPRELSELMKRSYDTALVDLAETLVTDNVLSVSDGLIIMRIVSAHAE